MRILLVAVLASALVACGGGAAGPAPGGPATAGVHPAAPTATPVQAPPVIAGQPCHLSREDAQALLGRPVFEPAGQVLAGADAYPGYRVVRVDRCAYPLTTGPVQAATTLAGLNVTLVVAADPEEASRLWEPVSSALTALPTGKAQSVSGFGDQAIYLDTAGQAGGLSGLAVRQSRYLATLLTAAANPVPDVAAYEAAARKLLQQPG